MQLKIIIKKLIWKGWEKKNTNKIQKEGLFLIDIPHGRSQAKIFGTPLSPSLVLLTGRYRLYKANSPEEYLG